MAVERGRGHADELLRGKAVSELGHTDRNLTTALVLGVLRWQIRLDEQIKTFLKRPGARLDEAVRVALRMGAFQLLYLDRIPAHAVIDESVELTKRAGHRFAAGMVNAVLRKVAAECGKEQLPSGAEQVAEESKEPRGASEKQPAGPEGPILSRALTARLKPCPFKTTPVIASEEREDTVAESDSAAGMARAFAHPAWMVERWARVFGLEAARAICAYGQGEPSTAVRLVDAAMEAELADAGVQLTAGELLCDARTVVAGDVTATVAFREGRVRVQDEGSQLIGEIAVYAGEMDGRKLERILDLCAAPGGKTLILAERNAEARIVACEASSARMAKLRERLGALGEHVEFRSANAAELNDEGAFDVALADVPCSGTGTLGRNPEIRHRLHEQDLPRQAERQRAILRAALRAVRPGGRVIYSTCSLEPEENEEVIRAVLAEDAVARVVSLGACIEVLESKGVLAAGAAERLRECITPEGVLRLVPGMFGTDGFFVALLERGA